MKNVVYMMVTRDKYELPLAIADTAAELARMLGRKERTIYSAMTQAKKKSWKSIYVKVKID